MKAIEILWRDGWRMTRKIALRKMKSNTYNYENFLEEEVTMIESMNGGNKAKDPRGPRSSFHYNGGDPHEWLDKAEHYFQVYKISQHERVSIVCFYLDDKVNKW